MDYNIGTSEWVSVLDKAVKTKNELYEKYVVPKFKTKCTTRNLDSRNIFCLIGFILHVYICTGNVF